MSAIQQSSKNQKVEYLTTNRIQVENYLIGNKIIFAMDVPGRDRIQTVQEKTHNQRPNSLKQNQGKREWQQMKQRHKVRQIVSLTQK